MEKFDLYKDIQARTGGEIYVGVVGPVRTGKSTFLRNFMELLVLPNLKDQARRVAMDEMPASASGRTVTTVEPKFIPREAARIQVGDGTVMNVRLADCVGFLVPGAEGTEENQVPRMVKTPWLEQPVPFQEAARLGTEKIITDHATVGIVITTDGSFGELPRENFLEAEKEAITQLQKLGKPFLVIVNSARPNGEAARQTAEQIRETYHAGCVIQNCERMEKESFYRIFEQLLYEFPVTRVAFRLPKWVETLEFSHWLKQDLFRSVREGLQEVRTLRDVSGNGMRLKSGYVKKTKLENIDLARGNAEVTLELQEPLYYQILSEMTGVQISGEYQLISLVKELSGMKKEYEAVAEAVSSVKETGYGVILPKKEEISMEPPVLIRQGNRYGVKIKAVSPSVHLIRAEIETEIAPIVGSESQAQDLISYMEENETKKEGAGGTLIFGKSIEQMVDDGIKTKLASINEESQRKLQETMKRIVNESRGKIICIIL